MGSLENLRPLLKTRRSVGGPGRKDLESQRLSVERFQSMERATLSPTQTRTSRRGLQPCFRWRRCCLALPLLAALIVGCQQNIDSRNSAADADATAAENRPAAAADQGGRTASQAAAAASTHGGPRADSAPPNRRNPIGHAIAVGGLREAGAGRLQLAVLDPADNEAATGDAENAAAGDREEGPRRHDWLPIPYRLDVRWGRQRPAIELREGRLFTIVGAVLIQPATAAARLTVNASAPRMPDLSQNLRPQWPGLCGATAAADLLYRIGHRDPAVIAGRPHGPAPAADPGADRLIAGVATALGRPQDRQPAIAADSLAGRMGNRNGRGATALGIVQGLRSWLEDHADESWRADLAFLDDATAERSPADQQAWFGRLGAAIAAGGGSLLLLWEGADWADQPTGHQEDRSQDSDPGFPPLPHQVAAGRQTTADSREPAKTPPPQPSSPSPESSQPLTAAVELLHRDLQKASAALAEGRDDAARRLAEQVLEAGLAIRFQEPGVEPLLDAARSITAEADSSAPKKSRARSGIRTRYDG